MCKKVKIKMTEMCCWQLRRAELTHWELILTIRIWNVKITSVKHSMSFHLWLLHTHTVTDSFSTAPPSLLLSHSLVLKSGSCCLDSLCTHSLYYSCTYVSVLYVYYTIRLYGLGLKYIVIVEILYFEPRRISKIQTIKIV